MPVCKLCKKEKILLKKSHIIPDFLYKELKDEKQQMRKFKAVENHKKLIPLKNPLTGEYDSDLLCRECDCERIGELESYASALLERRAFNASKDLMLERIFNERGEEFLKIENLDYKKTKLFLLSILWRTGISKRSIYKRVALGPYEEKIRKQLFENDPSDDDDIAIVILSWRNDKDMPYDVITHPIRHSKNGGTYYSIVILGYVIFYFLSRNSLPEKLNQVRLKSDNTININYLPKGEGMKFMLRYVMENK